MTLDHLSLADMAATFFAKDKQVASVTAIQEQGQRNPFAGFTVIGGNGAVLRVSIKRLMKGQEQEPEPKPTKPKAKRAPAKTGGKKK